MKHTPDPLGDFNAAVAHLGPDGLPAYPPRRPWPVLARPAPAGPLWVFGYGSLIWHPGFPFREHVAGRVHGHHRALCVWSWEYRGTPEHPGLVLGLDRGGSCAGVAYRVEDGERGATIAYLLRRELTTPIYRPVWKRVRLADARVVDALTFAVDRDHAQYAGRLEPTRLLEVVNAATGRRGPNADYVRQTVAHLAQLGIPCRRLERVAAALD